MEEPVLGLLLLPLLTVLLMVLCVRCRRLSGELEAGKRAGCPSSPAGILARSPAPPPIHITVPPQIETVVPWPPATPYPPVSPPDLLPIPRSPQPPGGSHQMPSSRQDSDGANSVASYENEAPACEDADEDEDEEDYPNEGYLEVLPDSTPAISTATPLASVPSKAGLRDSAFSIESSEDYVNVPESEESAEASLDGSREYVNVSQELQPAARTEPATLSSQEVEDEEEEEEDGAPDYENLQELN
ncbi:linker for activation of T-cells family member 1 [Carlito syrichta]|uniref:Linker for activation of T-cells family member 1 n=1 Tax=Carlito syrichta TaxID=1868482 RepID=A0A3Q0DRG5_CARSF|nr:linker for activation of T-cells family member 1 [Carlito syrichta]